MNSGLSMFDGSSMEVHGGAPGFSASSFAGQEFFIGDEPDYKRHRFSTTTDLQDGSCCSPPIFVPQPDVIARMVAKRDGITVPDYDGVMHIPLVRKRLVEETLNDTV